MEKVECIHKYNLYFIRSLKWERIVVSSSIISICTTHLDPLLPDQK